MGLCRALECDQISQGCDKKKSEGALVRPAIREKKTEVSTTQKVSLLFNNRHVRLIGLKISLNQIGLNQSEIVKGGPPSDWPWSRYSCTCVYI